MSDNKLMAFIIGGSMITGIIAILSSSYTKVNKKSIHEQRMEKIEELKELQKVIHETKYKQMMYELDSIKNAWDNELDSINKSK